jgi:hypothetical protein
MTTQFAITEEYGRNSAKKYFIHDTEIPNTEARIATNLMEKWGMVAGVEDGEDSSGRSKLRCMTPTEVVDRACAVASEAMAEFRKRGWIIAGPDVSELLKKADD